MAVLQRVALFPNERFDTPDARSVEAFGLNDWRYFLSGFFSPVSLILQGFEIENYSQIFTVPGFVLTQDDVVLFHSQATTMAAGFYVFAGTEPDQTVALSPGATNFVQCNLTDVDGTPDVRALWDPASNGGAGGEFSETLDTVINLQLAVTANVTGFTTGQMPLYKVITNSSGIVTSVTDCRNMFFRLGSGGESPDPAFSFNWPSAPDAAHSRFETPSTATAATATNVPFQGGDKNLKNFKDWMDAVMSILKEIKGTPYWYSPSGSASVPASYQNAALTMLTGGKWDHLQTVGHLTLLNGSTIQRLGSQNSQSVASFTNFDLTGNKSLYVLLPTTDTSVTYGLGQDSATAVKPQAVTSFSSTSISVNTGGNYATGGGNLLVGGIQFAYTSYTAGTGLFSGVTPDPSGVAEAGNFVYPLDSGGVGYLCVSGVGSVPGIVNGSSFGAERVLWLAYYPGGDVMFFRNGFAHRGEEIDVGDDADATAQDKNIIYIPEGLQIVQNNTNTGSGAQDINFFGSTPTLQIVVPGSPGGTIGLGAFSLFPNSAAWVVAPDRDLAFTLATSDIQTGLISSVPIDYNVFVIAWRFGSDHNIYLWDHKKYFVGQNGQNHKTQIFVSPQGNDAGDGTYCNPVATWTQANVLAAALAPSATNLVTIIGDAAKYTEAAGFNFLSFCQYVAWGAPGDATISVSSGGSGDIGFTPTLGAITRVVNINLGSALFVNDTLGTGNQRISFYGSSLGLGAVVDSAAGSSTLLTLSADSSVSSLSLIGGRALLRTDPSSAPNRANITFGGGSALTTNVFLTGLGTAVGNDSLFAGFAVSDALNSIFHGALAVIPFVIDDITTPPVSPTSGDRYIVGVGGTGAWAGQDGAITTWNGSAWTFDSLAPVGCIALVTGENHFFYQKKSSTLWAGFDIKNQSNFNGIAVNDVLDNVFDGALGIIPPVIDDLATPPGGPSIGDRYIVGAGATGAWAGQDGSIATWNGTAWTFDSSAPVGCFALVEDEGNSYFTKVSSGLWAPLLSSQTIPVGTILEHGSSTTPAGFIPCDGSALNLNTFATLFASIGNNFGAGSGPETITPMNFDGAHAGGPLVLGNTTNGGSFYASPFTIPSGIIGNVTWESAAVFIQQNPASLPIVNKLTASSYSTIGDSSAAFGGDFFATPFSITTSANLVNLNLWLSNIGATSGNILFTVVRDNAGQPGSTVISTVTLPVSGVTIGTPGRYGGIMSGTLAVGNYWIVVGADSTYLAGTSGQSMQVGLTSASVSTSTSPDTGTTWTSSDPSTSLAAVLNVTNVPVSGNITLNIVADNAGQPDSTIISSANIPATNSGVMGVFSELLSAATSAPGNYWLVVGGDSTYLTSLVSTNGASVYFNTSGIGSSSIGSIAPSLTWPTSWAGNSLGNISANVTAQTVLTQTFSAPDLRGLFTRMFTGSSPNGYDPDVAFRTALQPGGSTGNAIGSFQEDEFASHTHTVNVHPGGADGPVVRDNENNGVDASPSTNPAGGNETRPKNVYVNKIIKF